MNRPDEDDLCLIGLCATEGVGPATVARLREAARARRVALRAVVGLCCAELESEVGLTLSAARAVGGVEAPLLRGGSVLEQMVRIGGGVVLAGRRGYPEGLREALGAEAPPVLFLAGDASVLERPRVGIVGSRRPSRTAREAASLLARQLAAAGSTVVSGGARGIDTAAHAGALRSGGTAAVPALGVARFHPRGMGAPAAGGSLCVVGQFPPQAGWRAGQALLRNRTIVALSEAVVAFEPRDVGGTWHSSITALRMRRPLFVASGSRRGAKGRGLRRLVRLGAVALDPARMPDPEALACLVAEYSPPPAPDQLSLFDALER
ncbi:MAG: DNA-processing protein DprA [Planctomycetota bacterium]